jgi:palmitoyltransferase
MLNNENAIYHHNQSLHDVSNDLIHANLISSVTHNYSENLKILADFNEVQSSPSNNNNNTSISQQKRHNSFETYTLNEKANSDFLEQKQKLNQKLLNDFQTSNLYKATADEQELRVRDTTNFNKNYSANMSYPKDTDEFSNLKLYKERQFTKYKKPTKKSRKKNLNYYERINRFTDKYEVNLMDKSNNNNMSSSNDDDDDDDEDDDDDNNDEKYCCSCCKCPWPVPPGVKWCVKDVCGIVCATITWGLILYAEFVVMFVIILPAPMTIGNFLNTLLYHVLVFLAGASHLTAMFTDPGTVPLNNATPENIEKETKYPGQVIYRCPRCLSIKPLRAHHCSVCKRCVKKMDHHCPWVNNCIGENNQKYFVLFTLYICLASAHSAILIILHMIRCVEGDWVQCSSFSPSSTLVLMILLGFEALLFGIFTLVMFCTQVSAIFSDETQIESLKNEEAKWQRKTKWASLKSVFGNEVNYKWLSPFEKPNFKYMTQHKLLDV